MGKTVDEMFAFITVDDDGDESVPAFHDPVMDTWMPLMGADVARIESLRPIAGELSRRAGKPMRLMRFAKVSEEPL